jgi:hypothetical protein
MSEHKSVAIITGASHRLASGTRLPGRCTGRKK